MLKKAGWLIPFLLLALPLQAQQEMPHHYLERSVDSGLVQQRSLTPSVTWSETIQVEGATSLRLFFGAVELGSLADGAPGTQLRITSLKDGATQTHDATTIVQWRNTSAFFNGNAVRVELVAQPGAAASRVHVRELMVGEPAPWADKSICGPVDDRVLSTDPKVARIVPVGCTAWLINDAEGCFLTAGHCIGANTAVMEFNVPLSNPDGSLNHSDPSDQYIIDQNSIQFQNTGIGNDWGYLGAFPNTETNLTPLEAQLEVYTLGTPPSPPNGEMIRITGYGSVTGTQGTPLDWNQVQTTHLGPLTSNAGNTLQYATDTTGGNSGSAVFDETNGVAIGIHTNAGCNATGGANNGTSLNNAALQNVLANPMGICVDGPPPLRILPVGTVENPISPAGTSFQVDLFDRMDNPATINSANLVFDNGAGDQMVALSDLGAGRYEATFPNLTCGNDVSFRIDVEASNGTVVNYPFSADQAVDARILRHVGDGFDATFYDDFETDLGWTVTDDASLTAGSWERGVPEGLGVREDPPTDADGSGNCFLTSNGFGNTDVDGGATTLTSPQMDATNSEAHIHYWRWFGDTGASDDTFVVEISDDNGASWTTLETVGPNVTAAWVYNSARVGDFVGNTNQFRIRFIASDLGGGNIIEAAVDEVALTNGPELVSCTSIFSDGFESNDVSAWSNAAGN